ncbi:DNA polymerase Y family protein [Fulvimarina sp. MAC3]|uniref:Y-family DNA polymerase n=1 Tax=Fulvimarina sp. MAC3 TaxID=3148887 RepID=UPI0031FC94BA
MSNTVPRQRILACRLPHLRIERIARTRWGASWRLNGRPDVPPIIVTGQHRQALRVIAVEPVADLSGIQTGQSLSDARAIRPDLDCVPQDEEADQNLFRRIAHWCERYTPFVAFGQDHTLFLDISGCAHLFGGESDLTQDLAVRLKAQGFHAAIALADTAGAAWALTRHHDHAIAPPGRQRERLKPLPLSALRLEAGQVRELARLGLKTIGCLFSIPRAALTARFGPSVFQRLDQAMGDVGEALSPLSPPVSFIAERRFFDPIVQNEAIKSVIGSLCLRLVEPLERSGMGMRRAELTLFRCDGHVSGVCVETSAPLRDPAAMARLFDERLAALHNEWDAGFGFDVIRLSVSRTDPFDAAQVDMVSGIPPEEALNPLIDRLSARLGSDRVEVFVSADTHIPERRHGLVPALRRNRSQETDASIADPAIRPIVLFERPEGAEVVAELPEGPPLKFRWRKMLYEVTRAEGPERIACEWWVDGRAAPTRDYFRIETSGGHRFWLFRQGLYERETGRPVWFVQGLFA